MDMVISLDFLIVSVWCNVSVYIYLVPLKHRSIRKSRYRRFIKTCGTI